MNKALIIILILLTSISVNAQKANKKSNLLFTNELSENIVVHTDRDVYLIGEKILFKAFYSIPQNEADNSLSNVIYIEVYNAAKSFIKKKFDIENGIASGAINIPMGLLSGNYYIRAYTQYQRNSIVESINSSLITIINPSVAIENSGQKKSIKDIEIIPENNFIVQNIPTNIAIKLLPEFRAELLSITLTDQNQNIITRPEISKNGIGNFEFTPTNQDQYFLNLILAKDTIIKALPKTVPEGLVIKTHQPKNNEIKFKIDLINKILPNQDLIITIRSNKFVKLIDENVTINKETTSLLYSINILNEGINYLIVRDKNNQIIAIKTIYKHEEIPVEIKIDTKNEIVSQRNLVELNIEPFKLNSGEYSNLSVSIAKKGTLTNRVNPFSLTNNEYFLRTVLTNPYKYSLSNKEIETLIAFYNNTINSPNIYEHFFNEDPKSFEWVPDIRDASISGIIRNKESKLPVKNILVYASVFKNNPQFHIYKTSLDGKFVFSLNNLVNDQNVFLCTEQFNNKQIELFINNDFSNKFPALKDPVLIIDSTDRTFLNEMIVNYQSAKSFNTEAKFTHKPAINLPYNFDYPDFSLIMDDYIEIEELKTIFRELIPGVKVRNRKNNHTLSVFDKVNNRFFDEAPMVILDNITIFDINELVKIHPSKINKISVFNTDFVLGEQIIKGVVVITTKTDNFGGIKIPDGSQFLKYQTISPSAKIESIEYDTENKRMSRLADFRNLLYWNPQIISSKKMTVPFYTSDHCSEYEVIVQGFTNTGRRCYGKSSFTVVSKK